MPNEALATYLNDHVAGSVIALELLADLATERANTDEREVIAAVRAEIEADRDELDALMARLGISASGPRRATAWLTEKIGEVKLRLDDPGSGALRRLETLETVSLGIAGKQALWTALAAAAEQEPMLRGLDYPRLIRRAAAQREIIESLRLVAAREALVSEG